MWIDTWVDSGKERVAESHTYGSLNYFHGVFLPEFLWSIILICLVHSPYFVYLKILTYVNTNFTEKVSG